MEFFGDTAKLTKVLSDERLRVKRFGVQRARRIRERLEEIQHADTLEDVSHIPPTRLHKIRGLTGGCY